MASVSTYSRLIAQLQKARDRALKDSAEKGVEVAKDRVDKDVYAAGTPLIYSRTYQLRDSLDVTSFKSSPNSAQATISHDESRITSVGYLAQHASVIDGSSSVHSIAEIIHEGKGGLALGEGWWRSKRPYISNAEQELRDGKYRQFMIESLKRQGYKVK